MTSLTYRILNSDGTNYSQLECGVIFKGGVTGLGHEIVGHFVSAK